MTIEEASKKFNITKQEIKTYEKKGFIKKESEEYADETFRHLGVLRTLLSAGMDDKDIIKYLKVLDNGTTQEQTAILRGYRAKLLDHIHTEQQSLDNIDYLIYQANH